MKKGQELTGKVVDVLFPNKAIIDTEEGLVSAKNGIPGDTVKVRISKVRKGKPEANIMAVEEKASECIEAQCPHFNICGGCTYLTMKYEDELKLKERQIKKLLDGVLEPDSYKWEGIKGSPLFEGYRNKMEFSFGDEYKDGPLSLGMHKRGSFYDVVLTDECYICDEDYRIVIKAVLDYYKEKGYAYYHKMRHTGYLRHLLVRKARFTGEIMVALVTTSEINEDLMSFTDMLLSLPVKGKIVSILHTVNDSLSDVVQSDRTDILYGSDYINEKLLGLDFKISEFSFFQTNSAGAEVLYETAREFIGDINGKDGEKAVVFDLYSGTGTITQLMAPVSKKVIGVEIVAEAVEAAKENAAHNGIDNVEFICGDVLKALDDITEKPDFIILDPPRDGIHPKALKKIMEYGVDRLIYISCKPTSLVRDLELIKMYGYEVTRAACVDQFPWTANTETVCCLGKKNVKPKDYVEIGVNAEDYYRIKNSEKESEKAYERGLVTEE